MIKPGFVRLNFHYTLDEAEFEFVLRAVEWAATHAWEMLPLYSYDVKSGDFFRR